MNLIVHGTDLLFGRGDSDYPLWLVLVRLNILVFLATSAIVIHAHRGAVRTAGRHAYAALGLTVVAAVAHFFIAQHNLSDIGGIGYSRILLGYKGHFGAAQLYSLVYARTTRDLEHAIALNRLTATLTVPLTYALCRHLAPGLASFAPITAIVLLAHPLHLLFSATDAVAIPTSFLAIATYLLLAISLDGSANDEHTRRASFAAATSGLALLTQVRYENVLLLVPAPFYVFARRHALRWREITPGVALLGLLLSIYVYEAWRSGSSYQSSFSVQEGFQESVTQVFGNPIFGIAPILVGTLAATSSRHSGVRWLAPLPLLVVVPLVALSGTRPQGIARTYANQLAPLSVIAGYGLARLAHSQWGSGRIIAGATVAIAVAQPLLFWSNLRERYLETAEHDVFNAALKSLPPGVDHVIVPDDEMLYREAHSTMESLGKYQMIAAARREHVDVVGMTSFLERRDEVDCGHRNCVYFEGLPCMDVKYYSFEQPMCERMRAKIAGAPIDRQEIVAGSFLDCSIYHGEAWRTWCEPARRAWQFALYPIGN